MNEDQLSALLSYIDKRIKELIAESECNDTSIEFLNVQESLNELATTFFDENTKVGRNCDYYAFYKED